MSFITFMNAPLISASDRTLRRDAVPGLVVPQRAIAPAGSSALTLFIEYGVMQVDWLQSLPFNTTLGVRLCDALAQGPAADYVPRGPGPTAKAFEFVVHWPGCRQTEPYKTPAYLRWHGRRFAYEVAKMMEGFYKDFAKYVGEKGPEPGWDVQNGDVPFEKLFLLELRHVEKDCFQAVLSYDAD